MWAKIIELWTQTHMAVCFQHAIMWILNTHDSKGNGCSWTFCLTNDCSTIRNGYSLGYSWIWDIIGKLQIETLNSTSFRHDMLHILTLITPKLQVVCRGCIYRTTALLSEMSLFCVRSKCEIWMTIYGSENGLQSLSDGRFVRTYIKVETYGSYHIRLTIRGSLSLRIPWIWNCSQNYFSKNFDA